MTVTEERPRAAWFPQRPPSLEGETEQAYIARLTGEDRTGREPYDHRRNRQCSIGHHDEHSDPGVDCECPCHRDDMLDMLGHAAEVVGPKGGRVSLVYAAPSTWEVRIEHGGSEWSGSGGTPTDALAEAFRAAGWMD